MVDNVLTANDHLNVTRGHGGREPVLLITGVWHLKTCRMVFVIVKECQDDERVPDVVGGEKRAKLPPPRRKIKLFLAGQRHVVHPRAICSRNTESSD